MIKTPYDKLETTQAMAGRQLLGKCGASNMLTEAVLGDLGWLSIKSSVRLAKMRIFNRLQFLPPDTRLAKVVFLQSKAEFDASDLPTPAATWPASWFNEIFTILCDLNLQSWSRFKAFLRKPQLQLSAEHC
jgi:hypothetical protein